MITRQVTALDYQLEAPNLKTEIVHYNRMHRYTVREQYLYKSGSVGETLKIAVPILKVRDDSFFMNIIQNPHLLVLKRRAINNRMIPGIIQTSVDNSCRGFYLTFYLLKFYLFNFLLNLYKLFKFMLIKIFTCLKNYLL